MISSHYKLRFRRCSLVTIEFLLLIHKVRVQIEHDTRIIHLRNISTSPVAKPHKNAEIGNIIILVPKNLDQLQEDPHKIIIIIIITEFSLVSQSFSDELRNVRISNSAVNI